MTAVPLLPGAPRGCSVHPAALCYADPLQVRFVRPRLSRALTEVQAGDVSFDNVRGRSDSKSDLPKRPGCEDGSPPQGHLVPAWTGPRSCLAIVRFAGSDVKVGG
jgi:hypothetical protein